MDITEKIAIIPNIKYFEKDEKENKDLSKLSLSRYYKKMKSFEFLEITGEITIYIPKFVLYTLLSEYKQKLDNEIKKFNSQKNKLKHFIESYEELKIDTFQHCKQLKRKYSKELDTIEIPKNKDKLFDEIFRMALNKEPPFLKSNNSDSGFEESVIFLSFLEFAKTEHYDKYILILDKKLQDHIQELEDKFCRYTNYEREKLQITDEKGFEELFNEEYGLYVDLREIIDEKFIPYIECNYSNNAFIEIKYDSFLIEYCDFIKEQTRIYQVSENKFEVEIYFSIDLNFSEYHPDELYDMEDMDNVIQREVYIFEKIEKYWDCTLDYYDYSIYYTPCEEYDDHYPFKKIREKFNIKMPKEF